jgi:hypothetical protein
LKPLFLCLVAIAMGLAVGPAAAHNPAPDPWLTIPGGKGPGQGKTVILIAADEEYRSEETLPQLARILARRHGFKCVVLFGVDPRDGMVTANVNNNIPGLEHLKRADLLIMAIRWRNLPDDQMKHIVDYAESGKPMIALRTSTHPFNLKDSAYQKYTWNNKSPEYEGGFGRQVFGETWIAHHGEHGKEGTRGITAPGAETHPILRGIPSGTVFGPTDVYTIRLPLPSDSVPLLLGEVTETLEPSSKAVTGPKNSPMMPVAWTKTYRGASGKPSRVFTTTMGASLDLANEGVRRMLVNAVYWALGMERRITAKSNVDIVGEYKPTMFRFLKDADWKPGKPPSAY